MIAAVVILALLFVAVAIAALVAADRRGALAHRLTQVERQLGHLGKLAGEADNHRAHILRAFDEEKRDRARTVERLQYKIQRVRELMDDTAEAVAERLPAKPATLKEEGQLGDRSKGTEHPPGCGCPGCDGIVLLPSFTEADDSDPNWPIADPAWEAFRREDQIESLCDRCGEHRWITRIGTGFDARHLCPECSTEVYP